MHEAHCSCFVAFLALFEFRVPHWKWNLAVFDVSSQGHDLVGVHFSLIKFLLYPKAELGIDESRQVISLVPFLLETLPTLPLVSPYRAPGLYSKHVNRDRSGETLHCFPPREQSTASQWSPFLAYLPVPIDLSKRTRHVSEQVDGDSLPLLSGHALVPPEFPHRVRPCPKGLFALNLSFL